MQAGSDLEPIPLDQTVDPGHKLVLKLVKTTIQILPFLILSHIITQTPWIQTRKDNHGVIPQERDVLLCPLK